MVCESQSMPRKVDKSFGERVKLSSIHDEMRFKIEHPGFKLCRRLVDTDNAILLRVLPFLKRPTNTIFVNHNCWFHLKLGVFENLHDLLVVIFTVRVHGMKLLAPSLLVLKVRIFIPKLSNNHEKV